MFPAKNKILVLYDLGDVGFPRESSVVGGYDAFSLDKSSLLSIEVVSTQLTTAEIYVKVSKVDFLPVFCEQKV